MVLVQLRVIECKAESLPSPAGAAKFVCEFTADLPAGPRRYELSRPGLRVHLHAFDQS